MPTARCIASNSFCSRPQSGNSPGALTEEILKILYHSKQLEKKNPNQLCAISKMFLNATYSKVISSKRAGKLETYFLAVNKAVRQLRYGQASSQDRKRCLEKLPYSQIISEMHSVKILVVWQLVNLSLLKLHHRGNNSLLFFRWTEIKSIPVMPLCMPNTKIVDFLLNFIKKLGFIHLNAITRFKEKKIHVYH